jgi:hypothetical protein
LKTENGKRSLGVRCASALNVKQAAVAACLAAVLAAPASNAAELVDRVLAIVGSQVVTLSDARGVIEFGLVEPRRGVDPTVDALQYLVNRQLMLSEVDRYSAPSPDAALLAKRMAAIRGRFAGDAAFQQALARTAFTEARLRDLVGDNLRIEGYLDQRFNAAAQPTPEEVERYYLDHRGEFMRDGRLLPLAEVRAQAQAKVTAERRNFLIAEWLDRVRRRFAVSTVYTPAPR